MLVLSRPACCASVLVLLVGCGGAQTSAKAKSADGALGGAQGSPADASHNLLKQSDFEDGVMLPWMTSFSAPASGEADVKDGALCVHVDDGGKNRWDAQVRHREMTIQRGRSYQLSFRAWASRETSVAGKVGMSGPPYTDYWTKGMKLTTEPQLFTGEFKMTGLDDPTAEFALHFGGHMIQGSGPIDVCFDDLVLADSKFEPPPKAAKVPLPGVRVNQLGYFPKLAKIATVVSDAKEPAGFRVLDARGQVVFEGKTQPFGRDAASGDAVHIVDFSAFRTAGKGFVLEVGSAKSDPFDVDPGLYAKLRYDAFRYFYYARSGVEIALPYALDKKWTRPAGHPKDVGACAADAGCSYSLDVSGGWYDAGDYGKYVVNGGISVWTLMNWYERTKHLGGQRSNLADVTGLLPESTNKVPDVLDEARWELEFLLRMQVPEGKPNAGMVHHKMHDVDWSALGIGPHESKMERRLRPVSTAATLNLAATSAQAARLWRDFDAAFSKRCLEAAERAWAAAKKNPNKLAPPADTKGGGPYDDAKLADEFYWAAAELFITTGKPEYLAEVEKSQLNLRPFPEGEKINSAMSWQVVDALGKLSLAVVPSKLGAAERERYRAQVVELADLFLATSEREGYRLPLAPGKDGYSWGSNSDVLNNSLILALAYDFTKEEKYLRGVVTSMDYILGRNAMGQSYVTGYGERPLLNPHHRFFAAQANAKYPPPPPGFVSGGPNSGLQDPYVKAAGLKGCAPQKCFVDNIEAWSANEITINWNAPLSWVVAWLDERGR